ncbi:helix-turn-helix transcriptional regulator [candidate division TA06 bacterium]|uniref:Helix-turn-helix transcriptional regulator n=1 Tax=candidate division TA06 bacterium TaxID=2250710 RepID=A0A933MIG7_UNCT6|nr:helix-turn-helix transcriptional regulator [candidate division TA06 bacterium]
MSAKTNVKIRFGLRIQQLRKQQGITQEELGFRSNLHSTHIGMIERGVKNVTLETIVKLADALGISTELLFAERHDLKDSKDAALAEINGLVKRQNEKKRILIRDVIKDILQWTKR